MISGKAIPQPGAVPSTEGMVTLFLHQADLPANPELLLSVFSSPHQRYLFPPSIPEAGSRGEMWESHFLLEAGGAGPLLPYLSPLLMALWLLARALQSMCLPSRGLLPAAHVKKVICH